MLTLTHSRMRTLPQSCKATVATPYGQARPAGNVTQPIQWSSEYHDSELGLVYYKTADGRKAGWTCALPVD